MVRKKRLERVDVREQEHASAVKFSGMLDTWKKVGGDDEAVDWLARHVGALVYRVDSLSKRVAVLERQVERLKKGATR